MKSYTDLEQSRKLAEILPIESADMHYATWTILDGDFIVTPNQGITIEDLQKDYGNQIIPCWSLAALLSVLPKYIGSSVLRIDMGENDFSLWFDDLSNIVDEILPDITKDNPVDACVAMIEKLHELKML